MAKGDRCEASPVDCYLCCIDRRYLQQRLCGLPVKITLGKAMLSAQFGDQYREYAKRRGRLVPGLLS